MDLYFRRLRTNARSLKRKPSTHLLRDSFTLNMMNWYLYFSPEISTMCENQLGEFLDNIKKEQINLAVDI